MADKSEHYYRISKQIGVSYFFSFLIIALQPLLIALLTRILPVEEYGVYSLLFVTVSLLSVFFRFGIVEYLKAKIPGMAEDTRVKTIITVLFFSLIFLAATALLMFLLKEPIIRILSIESYSMLWTISIFLIVSISFYEIIDSYLISIKKIFIRSFMEFLIKCLWILALFALFFFAGTFSLNQVFTIWLLGVLITLTLTLYFIRHEVRYFISKSMKLDFERLKYALKFSLPLLLAVSFSYIVESSDRYIINHFLGKSDVAIYSLAYGIVTVIISLPVILQNVIQPYFAEKWNLKQNTSLFFNVMVKYTFVIVFPAMIGMFVLREELVTLISGPKYLLAIPLITLLLPFALFSAIIYIFNRIMFLRDMIKHTIIIYFIAAIFNIVFNIMLIPIIGISAAAYSTVISYLLVLIIMLYYQPAKIRFQWDYLRTFRILLAAIIMGVVIAPINPIQYWYKIIVIILGAVLYGILLFLFNSFSKEEKGLLSYAYNRIKNVF